MKHFNFFLFAVIAIFSYQSSQGQLCTGTKGPNLLGAKGTFSAPFITVNTNAASCLTDGSQTYNPVGNIGNALSGCTASLGDIQPCSDYNYTASANGMQPEFTYSIVKVMGDASGSNCLHSPIWQAKNHTNGDGGYFMAVNGAPKEGYSPIFYKIKKIPVCIGTTYEFSAWVINMMPPGGAESAAPNVSFVVNGNVIGTSGPIPYDRQWHQVGGQYTPTIEDVADPLHPSVDLQVINATQVAGGNDLGLDDISFRVCQSRIDVTGPAIVTEGTPATAHFKIFDPLKQNIWWKIQFSSDGGSTFNNITTGNIGTFGADNTYTVDYAIFGGMPAYSQWNGFQFRIMVSTSKIGLDNPDCIYVNEYRIIVAEASPTPVELVSFDGNYADGTATLDWTTSQEINNNRFELFRSFDGNDFTKVATIKGAGTSYTSKSYQYQDKVPQAASEVYYKLKQVDQDGKFTFSKVIRLTMSASRSALNVYPNPVKNSFSASFTSPESGKATVLITSTMGQVVYKNILDVKNGNNILNVDVPQLQTGMYYLQIMNDKINYKTKLQKN